MSASNGSPAALAVLIEDLFFLAMVTSAASKAGVAATIVGPHEDVPAGAVLAVLDLQSSGDWERRIKGYSDAGGEVVGFGPHVDGPLMKRARAAGCSRVMAKSKFVKELPRIMARAAQSRELPILGRD